MEKETTNSICLYNNIKAIEICKKYGVKCIYTISTDLTKDYFSVFAEENSQVIQELEDLNCWTHVAKEKYMTKFTTDVDHL